MATRLRVTSSHGQSSLALARAMHCECITSHQQSNLSCLDGGLWVMAVRVRDAQTDGHMAGRGRGLTELQGVTVGFWGGPQLYLWPQPARPL